MNLPETAKLQEIYGETEKSSARFQKLADNFAKTYKHDKAEYLSQYGADFHLQRATDYLPPRFGRPSERQHDQRGAL